ncbi:hypothetical protein [Arthrobacter sp. UYCu712]|uniref:hypothetical protein n=1 Tax=Arthrobacter sp. UYCu712 TaxID=3156340 RepID=UPI003396513A
MAAERITLDGQTLNESDHLGDWKTNTLEGWWGSPEPKEDDEERDGQDGDHDLDVYYKARYVTLTGRVIAKNHEALHKAMARFSGLLRQRSTLQIEGHGPTLWLPVKRSSALDIVPTTDTFAHWQVRVKAVDPRKLGERRRPALAPGTPAQVFHRGNYDASPVVQLNGPLTGGFTINHPGGQYSALAELGVGSWLRVDFNTGRLQLNGNDRSDLITKSEVCSVPPGPAVQFTITNGSGYVEIFDSHI